MMQRLCKKMRPLALIVYSCIPLTVAHMTMGTPLAFFPDHDNAKTPLGNAGGIFPCKTGVAGIGLASSVPTTTYKAGEQMSVTLVGGAVHGGGSCQFSLSYDAGVTWGVIHSIIGGCLLSSLTYSFTLPAELPPSSSALLGWTASLGEMPQHDPRADVHMLVQWFAHMGGVPEMYMNCAPVSIASSATAPMTVPAVFKANIADTGCKTIGNCDATFPKPGQYITAGIVACNPGLDQTGIEGDCAGDPDVTFTANGSPAEAAPSPPDDIPNPGENALVAFSQATGSDISSDSTALATQSAAPRPPSGEQEQILSTSESTAPQATLSADSALFKGAPQIGSEEVNFVAKNKAEAEAEYAAGLKIQPGGGGGQDLAVPEEGETSSQATANAPPQQTAEEQDTSQASADPLSQESEATHGGMNANQPSMSASVLPAAGPSTSATSQGTCSGALKCSDDGQSFFLCGPTGWISMGSVAAGTVCKDGTIDHANLQRRAFTTTICIPSSISCAKDGLTYSLCLADGSGYAPYQPVPPGHACRNSGLSQITHHSSRSDRGESPEALRHRRKVFKH